MLAHDAARWLTFGLLLAFALGVSASLRLAAGAGLYALAAGWRK